MPEHLRQRVPGHRNTASEAKFAIEYTQPLTPKEEEWQRHRRKRNVAIGVTASVIAIGVAVGVGMAVTAPMRNMEW